MPVTQESLADFVQQSACLPARILPSPLQGSHQTRAFGQRRPVGDHQGCGVEMPLQLTNAELVDLRDATLRAYPGIVGAAQVDVALTAMDVSLIDYPSNSGFPFQLFQALMDQNAKWRIADVIGALRRGNPRDPDLAAFEAKWTRTIGAPEAGTRLEGMLLQALAYKPGPQWVAELQRAFGWVCRIEHADDGRAIGTGFLVSDDLILTNYHVLYSRGQGSPWPIRARFDASSSGTGKEIALDPNAIVPLEKSPPGGREWGASGDPTRNELDFVVVRLSERIGATSAPDGGVRGHATIESDATATDRTQPLIVLEHPEGAELQICLGTFLGINESGSRLHHNATTQRGASGSPCLSMNLKVVAIHNGMDTLNTAVPMAAIASLLRGKGIHIG
jgi:hypothetical protein